jgi:hypothetical protein
MAETSFTLNLTPNKSQELGPIVETHALEAHRVGNCWIATTITDVQFGRFKGENDESSKEACVVYFRFTFGQMNHERIEEVTIRLTFKQGGNAAAGGGRSGLFGWWARRSARQQPTTTPSATSSLKIIHREPESWIGRTSTRAVVAEVTAGTSVDLAPFQGGPSIGGNAGFSRNTSYGQGRSASLTTLCDSAAVLVCVLRENEIEKQGVPSDYRCAVVLKTDGVDFSGHVEFGARLGKGLRLTAKKDSFMNSNIFRRRIARAENDRLLLERMESEEFADNLKAKVVNGWASF